MLLRIIAACFLGFIVVTELAAKDAEKVIVYNWLDYIPLSVLEDFTKETGIKVEYSTFAADEIMYTRLKILKGRGYDVLVSSGSMVNRMRNEGLIQPLNTTLLKNMRGLDPSLLDKPYDPGNEFSAPYLWGTTGMLLDTAVFPDEGINSWQALWSPDVRDGILLLDDVRDVFGMALKMNGYSINSRDPDEIRQAYRSLRDLMPKVSRLTGEVADALAGDEVSSGLVWNGDVVTAQESRPSLTYIYPKEGYGIWVDSFSIPARAQNYRNAHAFIDYMLRPDIAARCVEEMGYATPVVAAKDLLSAEIINNPIIFPPPDVMKNAEFESSMPRGAMSLYLLLWDKLKSGEYH